jgi:hypothetical protein
LSERGGTGARTLRRWSAGGIRQNAVDLINAPAAIDPVSTLRRWSAGVIRQNAASIKTLAEAAL